MKASLLKNLRTALLFLICVTTITAQASDRKPDSTKVRIHGGNNLTSDQKTKIKAIQTQKKKEMLPLRNLMGEKRAHLRTLETAEKTDMLAINSTIDELQNLKTKLMKLEAASKQEVRRQLTPEQRIDFDIRSMHKGERGHHKAGKHRR